MLGRTDRHLRMVAVLVFFMVFGSAAVVRLGYWQVVAAPELSAKAERGIARPEVVKAPRAQIIDRDGNVLVQSATRDQVDAHPNLIAEDERADVVAELADLLDVRDAATRQEWADKLATGSKWERLVRSISVEQSADVRLAQDAGELPGITLEPQQIRVYLRPGGEDGATLANQLIGFVDASGRGMAGIERFYDDRLSGIGVSADVASLDGLPDLGVPTEVPAVRLTLDAGLQRQLEKELFAVRLATKAKSVSAVVMDPYSGAILAEASVPGYDANDYVAVARQSPARLRDRIVSDFYEPGSVMKIFTVTAALDAGKVTPTTKIRDEVALHFYDDTIQNSDHGSLGLTTVKNAIARSRNNVAAKIAQRLAPQDHQKAARKLYAMWQRVGLAGPTGVDVANESAGLTFDPKQYLWAPVDLANRSFGQGVAVTQMQLTRGIATMVNGGMRVQPHIVADSDLAAVEPVQVLSPKVAKEARGILEYVIGSVPWYAKGSLIPGYTAGGKTGTAQIWDTAKGTWKDNIFNHSFIGFVGGDRPEAIITVRIEEPKVHIAGQGIVESKVESYELFRMVALAAIKHLGIQKSSDPNAGYPIPGTQAARELTPGRAQARPHGRADRAPETGGARKKKGGTSTRAATKGQSRPATPAGAGAER